MTDYPTRLVNTRFKGSGRVVTNLKELFNIWKILSIAARDAVIAFVYRLHVQIRHEGSARPECLSVGNEPIAVGKGFMIRELDEDLECVEVQPVS